MASAAALAVGLALAAAPASAQVTGDMPPPEAETADRGAEREVYTPADFARFAPTSALDMLNQVPGFTIVSQDQGRGLGQANTNVLLNGERLALKSETIFDRLGKIPAGKVVRIEIVDGATLKIPGLSGQVANLIVEAGGLSGQFRWESRLRPHYVGPRLWGGSASITGKTGKLEYSLSLDNPGGTGATKGPTRITGPAGEPIETRFSHLSVHAEYPKLTGTLKWDGPGSSVGNLNASYGYGFLDLTDDEERYGADGSLRHRDYDARERSYNYEIGGDFEFALGPGRLKLIGLERFEHSRYGEDFVLVPSLPAGPRSGSRYASVSDSGEHIGRAEYSWKMLGGDWQLAGEAAFNRYRGAAQLYDLDPESDEFVEIPFPNGTGGVTEDRYETILTHGRRLAGNLSLQIGVGGEYSKLAQTGSQGLIRTFWRPKGSASLAWTPEKGLDLSFKLARVVDQLSFGDFLARVDLDQGNGNAGNVDLVPPQSWQGSVEIKKSLGPWGSSTLKLFHYWYQDYIDWIPLPGGLETRGNVDKATLYGLEWNSTFNFDPLGWKGAKLDLSVAWDRPRIKDPLTGQEREFSGWNNTYINPNLRWDIPKSDWALGGGFELYNAQPYYRLREIGSDYEGPVYSFAFVENKDVFGLTVRAQLFNLTNGRHIVHRVVYDGPRDSSPVLFREDTDESVGPIFTFTVRGKF